MIVELKNYKGSILIPTITSEVKKDLLVISKSVSEGMKFFHKKTGFNCSQIFEDKGV